MQILTDVAFYDVSPQGEPLREIDFVKMATAGAIGTIIRAGQNLWPDPRFHLSWNGAKGKLPRGSYWFYDSRANPKRQAELWVSLLEAEGDIGELGLWGDFEDHYGGQYGRMGAWYDFFERVIQLLPSAQLGVYSNYFYWSERRDPSFDKYWVKFPLWIANYNPVPQVPLPWKQWRFWQFTSKGDGPKYGTVSQNVDLNYFNGTQNDFEALYGPTTVFSPSLPVSAVFQEKIVPYKEI